MVATSPAGSVAMDVVGLTFAFASSCSKAASDALQKACVHQLPDPETSLACMDALTSLVFLGAFFCQEGSWTQLLNAFSSSDFCLAWAVSGAVNAVAMQLYYRGLMWGELGDTLPYLSLTPAFLLISEYMFLDDLASIPGVIGTLLVSLGGLWLSRASVTAADVRKPARAQVKVHRHRVGSLPPGAPTFIFIAAIYSISSTFDKRGTKAAPALLFGAVINATVAFGVVVRQASASYLEERLGSPKAKKAWSSNGDMSIQMCCLMVGYWLFSMSAYWTQLEAYSRMHASYVSAVRRSATLFALLFGRLFFDEQIGQKIAPVSLMILGVCLVVAR